MHCGRLKKLLVFLICAHVTSCSSEATRDFEEIVLRVDEFFSGKPILIGSTLSTKDGEKVDVYYGIKIVDYKLSEGISALFPEKAFISVSCRALNNSASGDIRHQPHQFALERETRPEEAVGFSTAGTALQNAGFLKESELSFLLKYSYQDNDWVLDTLHVGYVPGSFLHDLKHFPQNEHFRKAVGIVN